MEPGRHSGEPVPSQTAVDVSVASCVEGGEKELKKMSDGTLRIYRGLHLVGHSLLITAAQCKETETGLVGC